MGEVDIVCNRNDEAPTIFIVSYCSLVILHRIPRGLLRGFRALAKSVPEGAKFRNTPSACGGDRNFEDFASLFMFAI